MKFQPFNRSQVVQALQEFGPMTTAQLAEHLDWTIQKVNTTIASTRWLLPEQVFRVVAYQPVIGRRARDLSVFAAEAGPDEPRKKASARHRRKQTQARYRKKNQAIINARNLASNKAKRGISYSVNPWAQLVPTTVRGGMAVAAST